VNHLAEGDKIKVERKEDGKLIEVEFSFLVNEEKG